LTGVPLRWTPWLLLWLFLAPVVVTTYADPDLWGHLRFGLDTFAHRRLVAVDAYSFTQDVPWINHEWLSELAMGAAYRAGGSLGLVLLKAALVSGALAVVLSALSGAWPLASIVLLIIVAWGSAPQTFTLRPQLWTLVGLCVLCRLLITVPRPWWLIGVPLLFALWVNLHGGWLVGAGLLAVWTGVRLFRPTASRALIISVAVLSALGTLVNPYGWGMWQFLASTVRLSRPISEWQPLSPTPLRVTIPYMLVLTVAGLCVASKNRPTVDRLAMIALLALAAVRIGRLAPLWVPVTIILMSPTVIAWSSNIPRQWWTGHVPSRAAARLTAIPILCAAVASGYQVNRLGRCISIRGDWTPDRIAGRALSEAAVSGTMVTWFDWGEYALWHLSPALRISLDGRRETVYSDEVLAQHDELYEGTPAGIAYLQRLNPTYVWVPASLTRLRDGLGAHGYRLDVQTQKSFVAVRSDQPELRLTAGLPQTECFPGP
jgi:hypothetical protein